ncbi:hypothetical protein [Serinicoccus sediminis]|uniref:hypothetical protein n=1 Tax=Serinicoccus sediminis TaxID=2306021 RepID=UPI00101F1134|nr:hypothetical protein [Serinicoccus sediminis]
MADGDQDGYQWRSRRPTRDAQKMRDAVRMREVDGFTFQQIAEELGLRHRASAQKIYEAGRRARADLDFTDEEHRRILVARYEHLYGIALKAADRGDMTAVREAGRLLDKIDRIKQLGMPMPGRPGSGRDDESDGEGVVVEGDRLEAMRRRKQEESRARTSGGGA